MASSKSSHRRQAFGIGLTVATWVLAGGVVFAVGSFAWRELVASERLQALLNEKSSELDTSTRPGSLQSWLDSHASKKDTEAWGRVLNEVSGPYIKSQMDILFMAPSEDPVDWAHRKFGESRDTNDRIRAWSIFPQELAQFLETVRPLRERIHELCKDNSLVYLPIADQRDETLLYDYQLLNGVCKLLFLDGADAVNKKDTARLLLALNSLEAMVEKFELPGLGAHYLRSFRSNSLSSALHLALDADVLDEMQLREWTKRLRSRSDWLPSRDYLAAETRNSIRERVLKSSKSSFLEGADVLPSQIPLHANVQYSDWWGMQYSLIEQDYHQSALVRMALTLMAMEQSDAPKSLSSIPSGLLQTSDWTNSKSKTMEYTFDASRRVGILKPKRLTAEYHSDTPLSDIYEIDFSKDH